MSAGKAYFEESESYFIWCCFGGLILPGAIIFALEKRASSNLKHDSVSFLRH